MDDYSKKKVAFDIVDISIMNPEISNMVDIRERNKSIEANHLFFMSKALQLAKQAFQQGEVPVGAVIVQKGMILTGAFNQREQTNNPLAHAELEVLREASQKLKSWRLVDCSLYVTLEPCLMCCGAILQARIPQLIYGCRDRKRGGIQKIDTGTLQITESVREKECSDLLKLFFKNLRNNKDI